MSVGQRHPNLNQMAYFAYSIRESVTAGAPFFFIMRIFRGGDGHCKDIRSLAAVSGKVSIVYLSDGDLTLISRYYSIF